MNYKIIKEILVILKVDQSKFYEENYDKEIIDYLKKIVTSSDKIYGRNSKYLKNKYYRYLYEYCYKDVDSNDNLDELRKIVFGFFYKADVNDLMPVLKKSNDFLVSLLARLHGEKSTQELQKILCDNGIGTISCALMYSLIFKDKDNLISGLLLNNAYIANQLIDSKNEDRSMVDKVIKKVKDTADKGKSGDYLVFETIYGLALADYCNNDKILKLNPFYDKEEGTRRFLNKSSIMDLENDANEYNNRYSKGHIISIDTAIDDIETLESSEKDVDDYSFYDCLTFLTNNAISKVRKENNIRLENTLLENLYMTKLLLETKSENRSKKSKIKKLI